MTSELITTIANVALTLSFVVAVIFGIAQVRTSERDRRERFAIETLRAFQTREFAELIQFMIDRKPLTPEELRTIPVKEQVMFIELGQKMESLGIMVAENFIDLDLVDKTLGSYVATLWEAYKPFTLEVRKRDPFLNEYFQWLAERIQERIKNNPRPPFYEAGK